MTKIVRITTASEDGQHVLCALADDGTLWKREERSHGNMETEWDEVPQPPLRERKADRAA